MKRLYCPDCKVRLRVGAKKLALCENCQKVFDLGKTGRGPGILSHPLFVAGVLIAFMVALAVFLPMLSA